MQHTILNPIAFDEVDLVTPTSTQKYTLGRIVEVKEKANSSSETASLAVKKYIYVKAHTGLTAFQPYVLGQGSTAGAEVVTAAPATLAAPGQQVVIPQVAFTTAYYGFALLQGSGKVLMTAETYAVGDFLQVLNAGTALVVDGTSGSPAKLVNSCAICTEAGSTAVARACYVIGEKAVTAAS